MDQRYLEVVVQDGCYIGLESTDDSRSRLGSRIAKHVLAFSRDGWISFVWSIITGLDPEFP